ncbi:hypothetical protein E4U26_008310 [Claviceps purpurea]|nr:hypothetical protein E4U26_008310 [Claviceps purpurea]
MERPGAQKSTNPLKKLPRHKRHRIASQVKTGRTFSTNEIHADLESARNALPLLHRRRCIDRDTDWVRLLKDGRKLAIHGTDGSSSPCPTRVSPALSIRPFSSEATKSGSFPATSKRGPLDLPMVSPTSYPRPARRTGLRPCPPPRHLGARNYSHARRFVPLQNGTIDTHNATAKFIGEPFGLPSRLNEMGVAMFPWDGKLESGSYAPEGRYRFVVRALRGYLAMPPSTCTVRQGL